MLFSHARASWSRRCVRVERGPIGATCPTRTEGDEAALPRRTDREGHIASGAAFSLSPDDVCVEFPTQTNRGGLKPPLEMQ